MNKIICIAGPTASGKTALAVELAKVLDGEVVSCDSMQVYRYMDIGTAKPTREEMQGVPHHMLDVADPREDFSVSRYCAQAGPIVEDILRRGKLPIVAGGTGLYMDSLVAGREFAPFPATGRRQELEERARKEGVQALYSQLEQVDPETAARLPVGDQKRVIRALEVYLETGKTISQHNRESRLLPPKFDAFYLALDFESRQQLYARIDLRVHKMEQAGLLEEIRSLLDMGIPKTCTAMQAIGYKEYLQALEGTISMAQATAQVQQSSRRYAKRQLTWFRRNRDAHWLVRTDKDSPELILHRARQILREFDKENMVR